MCIRDSDDPLQAARQAHEQRTGLLRRRPGSAQTLDQAAVSSRERVQLRRGRTGAQPIAIGRIDRSQQRIDESVERLAPEPASHELAYGAITVAA